MSGVAIDQAGKLADAVDDVLSARRSADPLCARAWRWVRILIVLEAMHAAPDLARAFGIDVSPIRIHAAAAQGFGQ